MSVTCDRSVIRARYTTLCDKVCQWLVTCLWFSLGSSVSSINKTEHHDITEILLKVALNTIKQQHYINDILLWKQINLSFLLYWLVRKYTNVKEHERPFNITLRQKFKQRNSAFIVVLHCTVKVGSSTMRKLMIFC